MKHFKEATLVITTNVVFDPDDVDPDFYQDLHRDFIKLLCEYPMLMQQPLIELKDTE